MHHVAVTMKSAQGYIYASSIIMKGRIVPLDNLHAIRTFTKIEPLSTSKHVCMAGLYLCVCDKTSACKQIYAAESARRVWTAAQALLP